MDHVKAELSRRRMVVALRLISEGREVRQEGGHTEMVDLSPCEVSQIAARALDGQPEVTIDLTRAGIAEHSPNVAIKRGDHVLALVTPDERGFFDHAEAIRAALEAGA
jgi:hypothetical protein